MHENYLMTPGKVLKDYLKKNNKTQRQLAWETDVSESYISEVINSKAKITPSFAVRLEECMFFNTAEFWMNLETAWQLWNAKKERMEEQINVVTVSDVDWEKFREFALGVDLSEKPSVTNEVKPPSSETLTPEEKLHNLEQYIMTLDPKTPHYRDIKRAIKNIKNKLWKKGEWK